MNSYVKDNPKPRLPSAKSIFGIEWRTEELELFSDDDTTLRVEENQAESKKIIKTSINTTFGSDL